MTVFWWIFVLLMLVSFTAGVTNYLASAAKPGSELPVNTLDELSQTDEIKLGCVDGKRKIELGEFNKTSWKPSKTY